MKNANKVWASVAEINNDAEFKKTQQQEFVDQSLMEGLGNEQSLKATTANRRDFLKYLGFGLGAATVAASCDIPVKKAIPYTVKPDAIVPGVANYYASTIVQGGDYCPVLVKTREGRPIKIEGNALSTMTGGGTSARVQAAVLSLYDTNRIKVPRGAKAATWVEIDQAITSQLNASSNVAIISTTLMSPTTKAAIEEFKVKYPNTTLIQYDPVSASAMLDANEKSFGKRAIPSYDFSKAQVIVSFEADFLGTWISPIEYSKDYAKNRVINKIDGAKMSRHYQFENGMSLTGSNADNRVLIRPSERGAAIAKLGELVGVSGGSSSGLNEKASNAIAKIAKELRANAGGSLVICGSNDVNEQLMVNAINNSLGNYGTTIDLANHSNQRQGNDKAIYKFVNSGSADAIFILDANPAFDLPYADKFIKKLESTKLTVSFNGTEDETTSLCKFACPDHHILESWGDAEPKAGHYSLIQPTISPLFDTRATGQSLLTWAGSEKLDVNAEQPYYEFLRKEWETNIFGKTSGFARFQSFWDSALHDGIVVTDAEGGSVSFTDNTASAAGALRKPKSSGIEISIQESIGIGGGQYAGNPWLLEMSDPVTRMVWENVLCVPVKFDGINKYVGGYEGMSLDNGDLVKVKLNGKEVTLPVVLQFGQMQNTATVQLGWGRTKAGAGSDYGADLYPALSVSNGNTQYDGTVELSGSLGRDKNFACVQLHHTMGVTGMGDEEGKEINVDEKVLGYKGFQGSLTDRSVINQTNLSDLKTFIGDDPHDGDVKVEGLLAKRHFFEHLNEQTLYPYDEYKETVYEQGHHWGMSIDLNACTGCGACTVACMAENNVPVVGRKEVRRVHEMAWLRIDRYYFGDAENPNTVYQPMMCQHCDNAPCENVCPVAATNHSSEGLNQMTYNRCIGTRYCANNCPYKVRRFNWLDYNQADLFGYNESKLDSDKGGDTMYMADDLTRMVLNPDVTVRTRGVIEKCSFCVQRIQEAKLTAKTELRQLRDGDVKVACQSACPTRAIVFGDTNDKKSKVNEQWKNKRNYFVLEEVNTRASVGYLTKVVNRDETLDA